ncbi:hypothetical protein GCM10027429_25680 [Marivirga atlantica]|jgi:hypothetical protein|uniref:Uncharacterized protein n=1 Tax=Marivirga atlantica TaxID=1548457 RepID=A0A937AMB1_9BACT|nr:hypothetical protein [Marivirga atlantica]MBL0766168.1 hypothetical protein [Marivirga atlantica]
MKLYTHPKLTVEIKEVEGVKYFKEVWRGIFNTVVFRDLMWKTIKIYEKQIPELGNKPADKILILSDTSEMELIREEDIQWTIDIIEPIYIGLGITYQAFIPPKTERLQDLVELYSTSSNDRSFQNFPFATEEDGLEWYLNQLNKS